MPPGGMSPDLPGPMPPSAISPAPANLPTFPSVTSMETGRPLESEPRQVDLSLGVARPAESIDAPTIPVSEANRFVGRKLRIVAADGLDVVARLTSADGDILTFEHLLSGGVMSFKVREQNIESLRTAN